MIPRSVSKPEFPTKPMFNLQEEDAGALSDSELTSL